jgi:hypothetical protein
VIYVWHTMSPSLRLIKVGIRFELGLIMYEYIVRSLELYSAYILPAGYGISMCRGTFKFSMSDLKHVALKAVILARILASVSGYNKV